MIFALDLLLRLVLSNGRENDNAVDRLRAEQVEVNDFAAPLLREYHDSKEMVWPPYLYWQRQSFHGLLQIAILALEARYFIRIGFSEDIARQRLTAGL